MPLAPQDLQEEAELAHSHQQHLGKGVKPELEHGGGQGDQSGQQGDQDGAAVSGAVLRNSCCRWTVFQRGRWTFLTFNLVIDVDDNVGEEISSISYWSTQALEQSLGKEIIPYERHSKGQKMFFAKKS